MSRLSPVRGGRLRFSQFVGTGAIGSGLFFKLHGNHTLGRNESRLADLVPFRDYFKLHIIAHYVAVLLGANPAGPFRAYPIGKVGDDTTGREMVAMMRRAGMSVEHVAVLPDASTTFGVCFQYPDGSGGNITAYDSASSRVAPDDIVSCFATLAQPGAEELILAAPEISLEARLKLLEMGHSRGAFNCAAVVSEEVGAFLQRGGVAASDLLALNIDEARSLAGVGDEEAGSREVIEVGVRAAAAANPRLHLVVTDGPGGSYAWHEGALEHVPAIPTQVVSTAGAGDALLAGVMVGLACGLPFLKGREEARFGETPLASAVELGTLLASLSVTSPDTIHPGADAALLWCYAHEKGLSFSTNFAALFAGLEPEARR